MRVVSEAVDNWCLGCVTVLHAKGSWRACGKELSSRQDGCIYMSSVGVVGGGKESERAMERERAAAVARRKNDGHVLCAPLAQRLRSIA